MSIDIQLITNSLKEIENQIKLGIVETNKKTAFKSIQKSIKLLKKINNMKINEHILINTILFVKIEKDKFITIPLYNQNIQIENKTFKKNEGLLWKGEEYSVTNQSVEKMKLKNIADKLTDFKYNKNMTKKKFTQALIKWTKNLKEIFLFSDNDFTEMFFHEKNYLNRSYLLYKIKKVLEKENTRIAFAETINSNSNFVMFANPNMEEYNYIDEGRYIYFKYYVLSSKILFFDMDFSYEELNNELDNDFELLYNNDDNDNILITKKKLTEFKNKKALEEKIKKEKQQLNEYIKKTIEMQNGEIAGIKISKNFINYNGLKIGAKSFDTKPFLQSIYYENPETDFNTLYERFCKTISLEIINYPSDEHMEKTIWLGKFPVKIAKKQKYYINNYRINKKEIREVLQRAICFNTLKEYNDLLSEVSKCSIKIHNILSNGLIINFKSKYINNSVKIKLNIIKEKNKHYIALPNKKIQIKNINSLINNKIITNSEILKNIFINNTQITENEFKKLIKEGLKEYKEAINRSEELLKETIRILNIKKMKVKIDNNIEECYYVKGKINKYIITKTLKIYTYPEMRYVCVIDKNANFGIGKDNLISRLYALSNDNFVINDIKTLK